MVGIARKSKRLDALVEWYKEKGAGDTTLQFPKQGADMLKDGPRIAQWIVNTVPKDKEIVLCQLAYMDGEAHVRISVAMDLICQYVSKNTSNKVSFSYLTSPATAHVIPPDAAQDAKRRLDSRPRWQSLTSAMSMGQWLKTNNTWETNGFLNALNHIQGPNYALAKTFQQWRCMVEYWKNGNTVSCPHAPPTRTDSMIRHSQIAAALEGMQMFEPNVSFSVDSSASLLTAILLYQVSYNNECLANPQNKAQLDHPMHIFWDGSVHGGSWRCPYNGDSIGALSFLMGKVSGTFVPDDSVAED